MFISFISGLSKVGVTRRVTPTYIPGMYECEPLWASKVTVRDWSS